MKLFLLLTVILSVLFALLMIAVSALGVLDALVLHMSDLTPRQAIKTSVVGLFMACGAIFLAVKSYKALRRPRRLRLEALF